MARLDPEREPRPMLPDGGMTLLRWSVPLPDLPQPPVQHHEKENHCSEGGSSRAMSRERSLDCVVVLQEIGQVGDDHSEKDHLRTFIPTHTLDLSFDVFEDPEDEEFADEGYQSPLLRGLVWFL